MGGRHRFVADDANGQCPLTSFEDGGGMSAVYDFINTLRQGEVFTRHPLAGYTTWQIGGPAEVFYRPESSEACCRAIECAHQAGLPVFYLGAGSNVLIADAGLKGLVVQTGKLNRIKNEKNSMVAEAGVSLATLSQNALQAGLTGLEFVCGIPGTLGGAVINNAGAHGRETADVVKTVKTVDSQGLIRVYQQEELEFAYRSSVLKGKNELIIEVSLKLAEGERNAVRRTMDEYRRLRREKQAVGLPNAGSIFKNPPGDYAGRLIEEAGLKGLSVGDAQVSLKHANFIVNKGRAKASDVLALIEEVQKTVRKKYSVELETEVVLMGFSDNGR